MQNEKVLPTFMCVTSGAGHIKEKELLRYQAL